MTNHQSFLQACDREGIGFVSRTFRIICACGRSEDRNSNGMALPPDQVAKKFKQHGWVQKSRIWTCLQCQLNERRKSVKPAVVSPSPAQLAITVDKPAAPVIAPTTKQVLAIGSLIEQYFNTSTGLYEASWSDDAVAKKLGLPRAMIEKVREEGYGPLKLPPELMSLKSEIDTISAMIRDLSRRVSAELAKYGVRAG